MLSHAPAQQTALRPGSFMPKFPLHMVWLATNVCNARCLHCSSNSARRLPDELNTAEARNLMDQFAEAGVVDLAVSGGEPLLRLDLLEVIAHARWRGISVGVGSNGAKLTDQQAAQLVALGVNRFQVSLDGPAESHDRLRCWPGLFDRAVATLRRAQQAGLRTHVCCTINRLNLDQLPALTEFVAGIGVRRLNFSRYVPTGRGTDSLDLSPVEWRRVVEQCADLKKQYRGRLEIVGHLAQEILVDPDVQEMPGFIGCQAGIGQGCVTANGTVYPCVLLPIPVGNIREQSFRDI